MRRTEAMNGNEDEKEWDEWAEYSKSIKNLDVYNSE